MRFAQAGRGHLNEFGLGAERLDVAHAAVPHPAAEAARHLEDPAGTWAFVRPPPLDPFGHELRGRDLAFLEIAVGGALFHGPEAPHAADHLEAPPLEQERFAGTLFRTGEHRAHHHALGARGERLHHIARVLDAAVGDHGDIPRPAHAIQDRRDLRDTDPGHDASRADRAGAHAHLYRVD